MSLLLFTILIDLDNDRYEDTKSNGRCLNINSSKEF